EGEDSAGISGSEVVVHLDGGAVLHLKAADVALRHIVIHPNVVRLAYVDAGVVGSSGDRISHPPVAGMRRKDSILAVAVRRAPADDEVIDANQGDALAGEMVDSEALYRGAVDALPPIAQTGRTCGTLLGDGDPLILATRILQDDGMTILDQTNQPQVVLGH